MSNEFKVKPAANHPVILLAGAALLWSTGGLAIKAVEWNALAIAATRSAIAAATVWFLIGRPRFTFSAVQIGGAVAYAATVTLFVAANKLTTAANAIFLQYTAPIYVAVLGAWFLREHPSRLDWSLIVVAVAGIGLFFVDELSFRGLWGNVCALASGVAFAALIVLLRSQKDASPIESVLLGNGLTALIGLPFVFGPIPSVKSCVGLLWLGIFQLGLAYVLYSQGIKHVKALESVLISTIEPVLNPIWVMLILGEVPSPWSLIGGTLVLLAATTRGVLTAQRNAPK
ncbi:MAG: EamA family transporter [Verrucomicrobia bacterium]|nr:EamA family transporter [Verrucomicrobiota bacterium]